MKVWIAAILITVGFTLWGAGDESLTATVLICFVKIAMIFLGGCLLINHMENEDEL